MMLTSPNLPSPNVCKYFSVSRGISFNGQVHRAGISRFQAARSPLSTETQNVRRRIRADQGRGRYQRIELGGGTEQIVRHLIVVRGGVGKTVGVLVTRRRYRIDGGRGLAERRQCRVHQNRSRLGWLALWSRDQRSNRLWIKYHILDFDIPERQYWVAPNSNYRWNLNPQGSRRQKKKKRGEQKRVKEGEKRGMGYRELTITS